jgi:hypothetical protein
MSMRISKIRLHKEIVFRLQELTSSYRIIADAAMRRFQCQRSYLKAHAGLRWMHSRQSILRGQRPNASHLVALQQADANLRSVRQILSQHTCSLPIRLHLTVRLQELLAITDVYVESTLRNQDVSQGKWLANDPSLAQIQQQLMRR